MAQAGEQGTGLYMDVVYEGSEMLRIDLGTVSSFLVPFVVQTSELLNFSVFFWVQFERSKL